MGWIESSRDKRKAQEAVMVELADIRRNGGRGKPGSLDPNDFVVLAWRVVYLGGWEPMRDFVEIRINCDGIEFVTMGAYQAPPDVLGQVPWSEVTWLEVIDGSRSKSRVAATVAFGVAGLGTKASEEFTELLVHLTDGRIAAFRAEEIRSAQVRARAAATLTAAGVPMEKPDGSSPTRTSEHSLIDELERLAELHRTGALTDEEFSDFKSRLRNSG